MFNYMTALILLQMNPQNQLFILLGVLFWGFLCFEIPLFNKIKIMIFIYLLFFYIDLLYMCKCIREVKKVNKLK